MHVKYTEIWLAEKSPAAILKITVGLCVCYGI